MSLDALFGTDPVRYLQLPPPISVQIGTPIRDVLALMRSHVIGCIPICDGHRLVGIFSERDHLYRVAGTGVKLDEPIESVMTANPTTLQRDHSLAAASRMMGEHGYRHIPILDEAGYLVGVLSVRGIIRYLSEHFPAEVLNHPPRPDQHLATPEGG